MKRLEKLTIHPRALTWFGSGVVALLFAFFTLQIFNLQTSYSVRQFFPKHHPAIEAALKTETAFQLRTMPAFFVTLALPPLDQGTWLDAKAFARLQTITDRLSRVAGAKSAVSLSNIEIAANLGQEFRIGNLAEVIPAQDWQTTISGQALLRPQLISNDFRSVLIVIEPKDLETATLTSIETSIRSELELRGKNLITGVAGVPAIQSRLAEKIKSELSKFVVLTLVAFLAMFVLFYRNYAPVIFVTFGLFATNVIVIGAIAALGIPFTTLLATLPIIVSIAFVSLVIHTLYYWSDVLKSKNSLQLTAVDRFRLSLKTLKEITLANFLGSVTTAIGFAALVTAPIPAIKQYAIVIGASVMGTFVITHILFAFYLHLINPVQRGWVGKRAMWMIFITRNAKPVFASILALTVGMATLAPRLNFSGRLFDDLPRNEDVRRDMNLIDKKFGGTVGLDVALEMPQANAWTEPQNLAKMKSALIEIRKLAGVGSALGATDFFTDILPVSQAAAAEIFFLYSLSPNDPIRNFIDGQFKKTRIAIRMEDLESNAVSKLREDVRNILSAHFSDARIQETGLAVNSHTINLEVSKELVFGFWQSMLIIGMLLIFMFRSLKWALIACLPNLVPPALLIGALALAQTPVKPAIALIFSIALGLAFNNTVYLLTRMRNLIRLGGKPPGWAMKRALLDEGNPCLSESLLTLAGFMVFLSSDFKLNQLFGGYMVLSILAGALGDLVFLPAMLKIFPRLLGDRIVSAASVGNSDDSVDQNDNRNVSSKAAAAVAALIFLVPSSHAVADDASDLLSRARKNIESKSNQATITLKIKEANGDEKVRQIRLKTLSEPGIFRALAQVLSPADVKGTALLAEIKKESENQWLYLPANKQVRRVVSGKKSAGVLGSELNPDDLNAEALRGASAKVIKQDAKEAWVEITPDKAHSEYTKAVLVLSMPEALPLRSTYYVGDKEKKRVEFSNYVKVGKVKRAKKIVVQNLENSRGTEVLLSDLKVNAKFTSDDFSQDALKEPIVD